MNATQSQLDALSSLTFDVRTMSTPDLVTRVAMESFGYGTDPEGAFELALDLRVGEKAAFELYSAEVDAIAAEHAADTPEARLVFLR